MGLGFNGSTLEQRAWGTSRVGSLAYYSTYSTIRVPFTSRLRITVEMPPCVTFLLSSLKPIVGMVQNDRIMPNTGRIQLKEMMRIKLTAPKPFRLFNPQSRTFRYNNAAQLIWVDIRGAEALPVTIGDAITLLPTEYRLRLHKNENVFVPSGDMIPMAMTNRSGLMFMTAIQVNLHSQRVCALQCFKVNCASFVIACISTHK